MRSGRKHGQVTTRDDATRDDDVEKEGPLRVYPPLPPRRVCLYSCSARYHRRPPAPHYFRNLFAHLARTEEGAWRARHGTTHDKQARPGCGFSSH